MMAARKPLLLKDYLEHDYESEFQCGRHSDGAAVGTVHCLVDAELRRCSSVGAGERLVRSRSMNALTRISAVINAVKLLSFPSTSSSTPRPGGGVGAKIKGSFWKKKKMMMKRATAAAVWQRDEVEEKSKAVKRVRDIVRLPSFDEDMIKPRRSYSLPSLVISSSRSSCSEITASSRSSSSSRSSFASSANTIAAEKIAEVGGVAGDRAPEEVKSNDRDFLDDHYEEEEEKDQLSPISVMNFRFEEEEDDDDKYKINYDSSSDETLANIERTKMQLLQKIRRFESLADLGPIDLQERFDEEPSFHVASSEAGHEDEGEEVRCRTEAWDLLLETRSSCHVGHLGGATEKLLLDFFFIQRLKGDHSRPLLNAAMDWVHGRCHAGEGDWLFGGAAIREMEENGRWRWFEKEEIGSELERALIGSLLEELVVDLGFSFELVL